MTTFSIRLVLLACAMSALPVAATAEAAALIVQRSAAAGTPAFSVMRVVNGAGANMIPTATDKVGTPVAAMENRHMNRDFQDYRSGSSA